MVEKEVWPERLRIQGVLSYRPWVSGTLFLVVLK